RQRRTDRSGHATKICLLTKMPRHRPIGRKVDIVPTKRYLRYVALGDSQTEGVGDGDDSSYLRGWADRLATCLAASNPGLSYANLAVRGRLAHQIRAEQLQPALALRPDL